MDSLAYNDGSHFDCTYDGNGNTVSYRAQYEGASGIIWLDSSGYLRFLSNDNDLNGCRFVWTGR